MNAFLPRTPVAKLSLLLTTLIFFPAADLRAAAPATTAAEEIVNIRARLAEADEFSRTAPSLEAALVAFSRIGASLDVFEIRYGVQPTKVEGWREVQKSARTLLPRFQKLSKKGLYFDVDSAATANGILLELAGEPKKAMAALEKIQPGGSCGNWIATVMMAVAERQSGISQRMGDYRAALAYLDAAFSEGELSLYHPNTDLQLARRGFLLVKVGREDEAIAPYQRVVDLYPHSVGDEIARRELGKLHRLIEPTAERITRIYLSAKDDSGTVNPEAGIFALAGHRFPESFGILSARLETAAGWERNRIVPALGQLGDPAALPLLREIVRKGDESATCTHALLSLHELGDDAEIMPFLEALKAKNSTASFELTWLHRTLREIFPDGPEAEPDFKTNGADFAETWLAWLRKRQTAA